MSLPNPLSCIDHALSFLTGIPIKIPVGIIRSAIFNINRLYTYG